jgi:GDSL-like Lipase/Acylhydrolase family
MKATGSTAAKGGVGQRDWLRELLRQATLILVTLALFELALRTFTPQYLKDDSLHSLGYRYDSELGWFPAANESGHNSLGLRDIEYPRDKRPTILFLGDSMVWGLNINSAQRMTERLREQMPDYRIVNAGVSGYGTDQEYLLLQRLWSTFDPAIVVLIFTCTNDRADNSQNVRYFAYKPYFEMTADGALQLRGNPPPRGRRLYFQDSWPARNLLTVRLVISAYIEIRHPRTSVPDPTEKLVAAVDDLVRAKGARLLFGVQAPDAALEAVLQSRKIPYTRFDGAEEDASRHWTPSGHAVVAERLLNLFSESGITAAQGAAAHGRQHDGQIACARPFSARLNGRALMFEGG